MTRHPFLLCSAMFVAVTMACGVGPPGEVGPVDGDPCEHVARAPAGDVRASCTPDGDAYRCTCEVDRRELGPPLPAEGTTWLDPDGTFSPLNVVFRHEDFCARSRTERDAAVIDGCPFEPSCLISFSADGDCRVPVFCADEVERVLACTSFGEVDACDCTPNAAGGTFERAGVCAAIEDAGSLLDSEPIVQIINEHCDYPVEF